MGLFSRKRTYVESLSMKLVEDTPDYVQQSVRTSLHRGSSISEDLITNMSRSLGAKMNQYYKYGSEHYSYGLPFGTLYGEFASISTVEGIIEAEIGEDIEVDYSYGDIASAQHFAEDHLLTVRGWNQLTDEVENVPNGTTGAWQLYKVEWHSSTQIFLQYRKPVFFPSGSYTYDEEYLTISPAVNTSATYYHVKYFKYLPAEEPPEGEAPVPPELGTTAYYWFYREGSGVYPVLDSASVPDSTYYPVVPVRYNKQDLTLDKTTDEYKTSKKLLDKFGLDIDEIANGVNGSEDEPNEEVKDVEHAYVMCGVSTQTESQYAKQYMYHFWNDMFSTCLSDFDAYLDWETMSTAYKERNQPPINELNIEEAGISYKVKMGFLYVNKLFYDGVLTGSDGKPLKVGQVETETVVQPKRTYDNPNGFSYGFETSMYLIRRQISKTQYVELEVAGLHHINYVSGNYTVDTTLADAVDHYNDPDNEQRDGLLIPINHRVIMREMKLVQRTEVMYEALRIMFQCRVVKKVKWYQTGFFQFFTIVVSIAITIYSLGTLSESMVWAAGLVGSSSVVMGAIVLGAITVAVTYGVALAIDLLGIESGWLLLVLAVAMKFIPGNMFNPALASTIQSGIVQGFDMAMDHELREITAELDAIRQEQEAWEAELEEYYEETSMDALVDPWTVSQHFIHNNYDETPDQYYTNRIHSGNPAHLSYKWIDSRVNLDLAMDNFEPHPTIKVSV